MFGTAVRCLSRPLLHNEGTRLFFTMAPIRRSTKIPKSVQDSHVQEIEDSHKSMRLGDRAREVSNERIFSDNFMRNQNDIKSEVDSHCYDIDAPTHLESVLKTNLPEPYEPENEENLKEGVPEGLSDCVRSRGERYQMEDRLDLSCEDLN